MADALEFAERMIAGGHAARKDRKKLASKLDQAAQDYRRGKDVAEIAARNSELFKDPQRTRESLIGKAPWWWKPGMPGYMPVRDFRSMRFFLRRGRGPHPKNWPMIGYLTRMAQVSRWLGHKVTLPSWNDIEGREVPTDFSRICEEWLREIDPDARIPTQSYRDILGKRRE